PERGQSFRVTEADIFVANVARDMRAVAASASASPVRSRGAGITDPGYSARLRWFIENFEHALPRSAPGLHKLIELMQPADRIVEKRSQHSERNQITDLHRARHRCVTAHPDD